VAFNALCEVSQTPPPRDDLSILPQGGERAWRDALAIAGFGPAAARRQHLTSSTEIDTDAENKEEPIGVGSRPTAA
jgi:hypothetical protein